MGYTLLADLIVTLHLAYVAFVVVGLGLILLGLVFRWGWVRNPWFRVMHLLAIAVVSAETILHINCPLTDWEDNLRAVAGQTVEEGTFIGRLCHSLFRIDLPFDHWAFQASYIGLGVLVLATFLLAPPRFRRPEPVESGHPGNLVAG